MTLEEFLYLINTYGEDCLLGMSLNNSSRKFFAKGEFSLAKVMPDQTKEILIFEESDIRGIPVISTVTLANVQNLIFAKNAEDVDKVNIRYLVP